MGGNSLSGTKEPKIAIAAVAVSMPGSGAAVTFSIVVVVLGASKKQQQQQNQASKQLLLQ